jgi:hypothetical protein
MFFHANKLDVPTQKEKMSVLDIKKIDNEDSLYIKTENFIENSQTIPLITKLDNLNEKSADALKEEKKAVSLNGEFSKV